MTRVDFVAEMTTLLSYESNDLALQGARGRLVLGRSNISLGAKRGPHLVSWHGAYFL